MRARALARIVAVLPPDSHLCWHGRGGKGLLRLGRLRGAAAAPGHPPARHKLVGKRRPGWRTGKDSGAGGTARIRARSRFKCLESLTLDT